MSPKGHSYTSHEVYIQHGENMERAIQQKTMILLENI